MLGLTDDAVQKTIAEIYQFALEGSFNQKNYRTVREYYQKILRTLKTQTDHQYAGRAYKMLGDWGNAGYAFEAAEQYAAAYEMFMKVPYFDKASEVSKYLDKAKQAFTQ